jgi:hypothetical protein
VAVPQNFARSPYDSNSEEDRITPGGVPPSTPRADTADR